MDVNNLNFRFQNLQNRVLIVLNLSYVQLNHVVFLQIEHSFFGFILKTTQVIFHIYNIMNFSFNLGVGDGIEACKLMNKIFVWLRF